MKQRVEHIRVSGDEPKLKPGYTRYQLGNALRGPMSLVARTDREAWVKGTRRIQALVNRSKRLPREKPGSIMLYLEREVPVPVTDRVRRESTAPATCWITVMAGYSSDPWPKGI